MVLGPGLKVINLNILSKSSRNELKYSLKIAFMFLSIILKFQVPDINILLGVQKKATVFDQGRNMVYGLRAQSPKYDWDQGSEEKAQGSEEWDQGSQGF